MCVGLIIRDKKGGDVGILGNDQQTMEEDLEKNGRLPLIVHRGGLLGLTV